MISSEIIRRYPYFAGLSHEQIVNLAKIADEVTVEANHYFFHEGDGLESFYMILEGAVAIVIGVPDREVGNNVSAQLTGALNSKDIVISAIGPGEVFGWSALITPYKSTASGKATTPCRVVVFDCQELRKMFERDCRFGYLMLQKTAQVIRDRLRKMRVESLAHLAA
jgi:CRP-like cAMP-binding protein